MKTILSAKVMQDYAAKYNMSAHDFMAVVDVWTPMANHYHSVVTGQYTSAEHVDHICSQFGNGKEIKRLAKHFLRLLIEHQSSTDMTTLFNPNTIHTVTIDGVLSINNKMSEFKADWTIKISPEFLLKMQMCESGTVTMDTMMDIVYRSRVYKSKHLVGSRIGCDCEVHRLGASLLNEINPMLDGIAESITEKQALMYVFEDEQICIKAVD